MLADPRVRKLSFTGSTGVGRALLAEAAKIVVSCSMELGGNAPFLVFDDADLEAALDGAMVAKMRNAGEACTAANRFYVQSGIHDAFVEGLTARMAALKVGPGTEPATECGPMITAKAVDKIDRLVEGRRRPRARGCATGGGAAGRHGHFYPPTVLADVPPDAEMAREEIFGPVAAVYPVRDRGGGDRARQRHRVRARRLCLHRRSRARPARRARHRGRHGRAQPRAGVGSGGAVRRRQAERARAARAA